MSIRYLCIVFVQRSLLHLLFRMQEIGIQGCSCADLYIWYGAVSLELFLCYNVQWMYPWYGAFFFLHVIINFFLKMDYKSTSNLKVCSIKKF